MKDRPKLIEWPDLSIQILIFIWLSFTILILNAFFGVFVVEQTTDLFVGIHSDFPFRMLDPFN